MKKIITLAALLAAGTAFAQTAWVEVEDDQQMVQSLNVTVDQLEDMDLFDAAGTKIGEVEDVLGAAKNEPSAVSIDADQFLGDDKGDVVLTLDQIQMQDGKLVTQVSKQQMMSMPRRDD